MSNITIKTAFGRGVIDVTTDYDDRNNLAYVMLNANGLGTRFITDDAGALRDVASALDQLAQAIELERATIYDPAHELPREYQYAVERTDKAVNE